MLNNQVVTYEEWTSSREEAFESIESCYEKIKKLEEYFENANISTPSQPYANFRDALFHFKKIYESQDLLRINGNMYTLREHLLRSVKDCMVYLIIFLTTWIERFFSIQETDEKFQNAVEKNCAEIKNMLRWNANMFDALIKKLSKEPVALSYDERTLKRKCFSYCVQTVQKNPDYIAELRKHFHILKNHNHKLRSSSAILDHIATMKSLKVFAMI